VLTKSDPAFSAEADLTELRDGSAEDLGSRGAPLPACATPFVGAVNCAADTDGLELARSCHPDRI
jgi:enoyl-CoA hydratase/carnithine racemase